MSSKPRVLVDVDGVLAQFARGFLKLVNAQFGTEYKPEDVTEYDIGKSLGWSLERTEAAYRLISNHERFADKLEPTPGADLAISWLLDYADLYIVTSPWWSNKTWVHDRNNWLWRHFGIGASRVVHTAAKHLVRGDVLVDDKTSTCEEWRAAWPNGVSVLWATPHNRRDLWDGQCTNNWDHLIEIVKAVRR